MKTIHYMSLTADGHVVQAETAGGIPPSILGDFMRLVSENGGLILGRRTYDIFLNMGAIGAIPGAVVVISRGLPLAQEGVTVARSPAEALRLLEAQGHVGALVGGGPEIYSAFLAEGLVDELHLNIVPMMDGAGLSIATPMPRPSPLELVGSGELADGVFQLRYRRRA